MDRGALGWDRGWRSAALSWGLVSGIAFLTATMLFLVEAAGLLGAPPAYPSTGAGQLQDEAVYKAAFFAYRNATLWDYLLRDGLYVVAYLGLVPLVLAANRATGGRRASIQIGAAFVGVGAVFGVLNAVAFFVATDYWRYTGWEQIPPETMVTVGRVAGSFDQLSGWCGTAAYGAMALGLGYLGHACRTDPAMPRWLGPVAYAGVVCLASLVVLHVAKIDGMASVWNLLALAVGALIAPVFAIGLGLHLGRFGTGAAPVSG